MHIAICFFGLTRSLKFTIESIEKIFKTLSEHDITYTTFLHTYNKENLTNPRSNEINCELDTEEYKLLNCDNVCITNQESFLSSLSVQFIELLKIKGDAWNDNFISFTNFLCQLNSLQIVTNQWKTSNNNYDLVLYLRPDLLYNELQIQDLINSKEKQCILTPNYHLYSGFNDRIAIGPPALMDYYGNRFNFLLEYSKIKKVHSESFLKYVIEKNNINHETSLQLKGKRIRASGELWPKDTSIF